MPDTRLEQITDLDKQILVDYFQLYPSKIIAENYQKITGKSISHGSIRAKISRILSKLDKKQLKDIFGNEFEKQIEIIQNRRRNNDKEQS